MNAFYKRLKQLCDENKKLYANTLTNALYKGTFSRKQKKEYEALWGFPYIFHREYNRRLVNYLNSARQKHNTKLSKKIIDSQFRKPLSIKTKRSRVSSPCSNTSTSTGRYF